MQRNYRICLMDSLTCPLCFETNDIGEYAVMAWADVGIISILSGRKIFRQNLTCPSCNGTFGIDEISQNQKTTESQK